METDLVYQTLVPDRKGTNDEGPPNANISWSACLSGRGSSPVPTLYYGMSGPQIRGL